MAWFTGDTYINNTEMHSTEVRVAAGAIVILVAMLLCYLCLKTHAKFTQAKMRETAQRAVMLNNVTSQSA